MQFQHADWNCILNPLVKLLTGGSARAHTRLILTFAASSVLTYIAVPNSCYQSYFEMRNRRSRRWKERSSLPTIGSAKRWEVVGNIRIINVISFGYIVVILFCLAVFSRLGRQCKPPRLDLSETLHQFEFWHGLHESFLRKPSSDISTSPSSSGHSSDFQFYGPSLILYSSATCGVSTTRPCVSPHHMSL